MSGAAFPTILALGSAGSGPRVGAAARRFHTSEQDYRPGLPGPNGFGTVVAGGSPAVVPKKGSATAPPHFGGRGS